MELSTGPHAFVCPACGGGRCVSVAEGIGQVLDCPVSCEDCGARVRLIGLRTHLIASAGVLTVFFALYFTALFHVFRNSQIAGYLVLGAMLAALAAAERYARRKFLRWELGGSDRGPDEVSFSRSLKRNWGYLVPPALFGPIVAASGGFHALPMPVIAILFFGCLGSGFVPVLSGRAPFMFWPLALILWFVGAALALILR